MGALSVAPALLVIPKAQAVDAPKRRWAGVYSDPNHPRGYRLLSPAGKAIIVSGVDEPGDSTWRLVGNVLPDGRAEFDFAPDGPKLLATWHMEGVDFDDGNSWSFVSSDVVAARFVWNMQKRRIE